MTTGPLALVGSGEYTGPMLELERRLIAGRAARYVQLATAAAPEGATRLRYWRELGAAQARRIGVEPVDVPVTDRASADDPANAALVEGAGLVYLSGGNPGYLAATLAGTAVWAAIVRAWRGGAALAGCSAGAMAMCGTVLHPRRPADEPTPGLGVLPGLRVIPHFDRFAVRFPAAVLGSGRAGGPTVVGVDEDTALVHGLDGADGWSVYGVGGVHVFAPGFAGPYAHGEAVALADRPLPPEA